MIKNGGCNKLIHIRLRNDKMQRDIWFDTQFSHTTEHPLVILLSGKLVIWTTNNFKDFFIVDFFMDIVQGEQAAMRLALY